MMKPNFRKAVMLGLGMAVFSTSIAFAEVGVKAELKRELITEAVVTGSGIDGSEVLLPEGAVSLTADTNISDETKSADGNEASDVMQYSEDELMYATGIAEPTDAKEGADGSEASDVMQYSEDELMYATGIADTADDTESAVKDSQVAEEEEEDILEDVKMSITENQVPYNERIDERKNQSSVTVLALAGGVILVGGLLSSLRKRKR